MGYTITPTELKSRLDKGDQLVLLDVREPWEFDLAKLNGSTLIPLATLPQSLGKLNRETEIVAICHHGMRSADATNFLLQQGFSNVKNLVGGIDAWSAQVDRSVPRYYWPPACERPETRHCQCTRAWKYSTVFFRPSTRSALGSQESS